MWYKWVCMRFGLNFFRGILIVKFLVFLRFCSFVFWLVSKVLVILFMVNVFVILIIGFKLGCFLVLGVCNMFEGMFFVWEWVLKELMLVIFISWIVLVDIIEDILIFCCLFWVFFGFLMFLFGVFLVVLIWICNVVWKKEFWLLLVFVLILEMVCCDFEVDF